MSNKINKRRIPVYFVIFLSVAWICTVYLGGLKGYVLDGVTGAPIKNAYIVTTIDLYPYDELCNLGGANSRTVGMFIAKSDNAGRFEIAPFFAVHFGFLAPREFVIYKTGYCARRFFQRGRHSFDEDVGISTQKARLTFSNGAYLFPLQKESSESNEVIYALGLVENYSSQIKHDAPRQYEKLKPAFLELLALFTADSEEIKTTLWPPHVKDNWESSLLDFRSTLDMTESNGIPIR